MTKSNTLHNKILQKLEIEENFLNRLKDIYIKPRGNISLDDKRLNALSLMLGRRQRCLLLPLSFNIVLEFLARKLVKKKK